MIDKASSNMYALNYCNKRMMSIYIYVTKCMKATKNVLEKS